MKSGLKSIKMRQGTWRQRKRIATMVKGPRIVSPKRYTTSHFSADGWGLHSRLIHFLL